jgi:nucleoid-associated protein YgaU
METNGTTVVGSYTVVKGDSLWSIAVKAYGDGYKWVSIAKANKLDNPNVIHAGNVLVIPK